MSKSEQKSIDNLANIAKQLLDGSKAFQTQIEAKVEKIEKQVNATYLPCNLEAEVLSAAQKSISAAITATLMGYGSPLTKFIVTVVDENAAFLKQIISDSFNQVIRLDDFKAAIVSGFSHKVARSIIGNQSGLFDKVSNDLKQDAVFKSKMALAVANVVEECLKEKILDK